MHHEPTIIDFQGDLRSFSGAVLIPKNRACQKTEPHDSWQKMGAAGVGGHAEG